MKYSFLSGFLFFVFLSFSQPLQEININTGSYPGLGINGDITESGSNPNNFAELNGKLIFTTFYAVSNNNSSFGIHMSDGTPGGTSQISTLIPYTENNTIHELAFVTAGSNAFFKVRDYSISLSSYENRLWKTNGLTAGTVLVKDLLDKEFVSNLCEMNGHIYFMTKYLDPVWGNITHELWKTDGTLNGTVVIQSWQNTSIFPNEVYIRSYNNKVYFSGFESNGTLAGTIQSGVLLPHESNSCLYNGLIYYRGSDGKLWRTDGTVNGTFMAVDFPVSGDLLNANGLIYFSGGYVGAGQTGVEICKTDGTVNNTIVVKDIYYGYNSSNPTGLVLSNGLVFFKANDGINGVQLWKTDGTANGTQLVNLFNSSYYLNYVRSVSHDDLLYFTVSMYGTTGWEEQLWKTDGTGINTSFVQSFDSIGIMKDINCNLFLSADNNSNWYNRNVELWSDTSTCMSAGLTTISVLDEIRVFPNPATDKLTLQTDAFKGQQFVITDQLGQIVMEGELKENRTEIIVENLSKGCYLINFSDYFQPKQFIKY